MKRAIEYDDSKFRALIAEFDEKQRKRMLRGSMRGMGNVFKSIAKRKFLSAASGLNKAEEISTGIRVCVWKRKAGFRVTIGPKTSRKRNRTGEEMGGDKCTLGSHRNRKGKLKPILMWVETGGSNRKTQRTVGSLFGKRRKSHSTGTFQKHPFMEEAQREFCDKGPAMYKEKLKQSIIRTAKKYGAKM